ncbi:MAG: hypothetical protein ACC650_07140 [Gammaproteobacteria bacterium]
MKINTCLLLLIVFNMAVISEVNAQNSGVVLCRMLESSVLDPMSFDKVIDVERNHFDDVMFAHIQSRIGWLSNRANQHDASCEIYRNNPMQYTQCKGSGNTGRYVVVWLGSLGDAVRGSSWNQTQMGQEQIAGFIRCRKSTMFNCDQLLNNTTSILRQICPAYLGSG